MTREDTRAQAHEQPFIYSQDEAQPTGTTTSDGKALDRHRDPAFQAVLERLLALKTDPDAEPAGEPWWAMRPKPANGHGAVFTPEPKAVLDQWLAGGWPMHSVIPPGGTLSKHSRIAADQVGKIPGRCKAGVWTGILQWPDHVTRPRLLRRYVEAGGGLCINLARLDGTNGLVGVDVDCLDVQRATTITALAHQHLGASPVRTGRAPKALLVYRRAFAMPKQTMRFGATADDDKVELLGDGQQFIAAGIHPKTGKPYTWDQPLPPLADITVVTEQQIEDFTKAVAALPGFLDKHSNSAPGEHEPGIDIEMADDPLLSALHERGMYLGKGTLGWHKILCPWRHLHGERAGGTSVLPKGGGVYAYHCVHTHGHKTPDFIAWAKAEGLPITDPSTISDEARAAMAAATKAPPTRQDRPGEANEGQEASDRPGLEKNAPGAAPAAGGVFAGVVPSDLWARWVAPPLPHGVLPQTIDALAWHRCELAGFDPGFSGLSMLTVCAAAIPTSIQIQVKDNEPSYTEPAILWTMFIGPPSVKKSPVFKAAMAPALAEQAAANEEHHEALVEHNAKKGLLAAAKKESERAAKHAQELEKRRTTEAKQAAAAAQKQRIAEMRAKIKAAKAAHAEACKAAKTAGQPLPELVLPEPSAPEPLSDDVKELHAARRAAADASLAVPSDDVGEPPVRRRVVADDATVEALSEILKHEINATGQLLVGSEEGIAFIVPSGYSGAQSPREIAARLELSGSGSKLVDRVSRPDVYVPEWCLSFVGTTQPDTLTDALRGYVRNGMLQRMFWLHGNAYRESNSLPERIDLRNEYSSIVQRLYALRGTNRTIQFSPEAHLVRCEFSEYIDSVIALVEYDEPRLADHLGKFKGYFARVCLVMHLVEHGDGIERAVSSDTTTRASCLFRDYLIPHIAAFYELIAEGTRDDLVPAALRRVAQVASLILRKGLTTVTAGVLGAGLNFWSNTRLDEQSAVLSTLVSHGWLRTAANTSDTGTFLGEEGISRGRPTLWRYEVNPAVHDGRFAARRTTLQAAADAKLAARNLPKMGERT